MRLTERPRSLAEMRPGTHWPEPVQRVMDRALQRDVKARYGSASEMARELAAALLAMPETSASGAATQQIAAAIPPTRVASRDASTSVLTTDGPAARRRNRLSPLVAASGVVVILSAAGAAWTMTKDEPPIAGESGGVTPDSAGMNASQGAGDDSAGTVAAPVSGETPSSPRVAPPDETVSLRQPAPASPSTGIQRPAQRPAETTAEREPGPATIDLRLRGARTVIDDNLQAERVDEPALRRTITVLTSTLPDITSASDSIEARYLRAQALGLVGETDRSCRELGAIALLQLSRSLRTEIGALRASACQ